MLWKCNSYCTFSKFLAKLPDNGQKIGQLVDKIKHEIKRREDISVTSGLFAKMTVTNRCGENAEMPSETSILQDVVNKGSSGKMVKLSAVLANCRYNFLLNASLLAAQDFQIPIVAIDNRGSALTKSVVLMQPM